MKREPPPGGQGLKHLHKPGPRRGWDGQRALMHGLTMAEVLENGERRRAGGVFQGQGREQAPVPRYSFIPDVSKPLGLLRP